MRRTDGIYELHYQRREYGELTMQLYHRDEHGQLAVLDTWEAGPFDHDSNLLAWALKRLLLDVTAPL